MSIFRCKMCGGTIEFEQGATVGVCDSCGTKQTLPRLDDDRKANLYDRANHFRRNNEFDKAMGIYEQILNGDNSDAEAYWSLVLCRYGIEYVEDPSTHKRIPTVNRAQFTSVFDDDNYKSALQYADGYQRSIYEEEAKVINEIQKGILAISQKEEPFDVFICYKETDASGRRTQDSVLANDLYHQLTQEGFRVFFSRITLEDKLGTAYEPYIFAALNSAKAMVVLGTKPEYFNAVWVKNEWSRYLALIKNGAKKVLIPAYRDMDPYDLPEEFSHLQALDMSKLGFMQDLIRGIKKIISADTSKSVEKETVVVNSGGTNLSALLERAFMFLEDGDWQSATEYCEKVLDADPRNAMAYLGKLMAELHVRKREALADCADPFDNTSNYQKTIRFANELLRKELSGYIEHINARNERARLEEIYSNAASRKSSAKTESDFKKAAEIFSSIIGYRDSSEQEQVCLKKAEDARKNAIYSEAASRAARRDIFEIEKAIELYRSISEWKDSFERIYSCQERIEKIKIEDEQKRIQDVKDKKARTKKAVIGSSIVAACVAVMIVLVTVIIPTIKYNQADKLLLAGNYEGAMDAFRTLKYKDSYEKYCTAFSELKAGFQNTAEQYLSSGDKIKAAIYYTKAGMPMEAKKFFDYSSVLAARQYMTAGITTNGNVYYQTNYEYDHGAGHEVQGMVRILPNADGFTGLTSSGQIISHDIDYTDELAGYYGDAKTAVDRWTGIVDFCNDYDNYYALMSDGTVKTYINDYDDELQGTSSWKNITSIQIPDAYRHMLIGIDNDGHVSIAYERDTSSDEKYSVESWGNVVKVCYAYNTLIGLKNDNTLSVVYNSKAGEHLDASVLDLNDIVDIVYSEPYLAILHKDGSVSMELIGSFTSTKEYIERQKRLYLDVIKEIESWNGIVALYHDAGGYFGIRYDGTVKYISDDITYESKDSGYSYDQHSSLMSEVESWTDIIWVDGSSDSRFNINWVYAVGLKTDGAVIATGDGTYYTTEKDAYGNGYHGVSHSDGNYNNVSAWKLWE